MLCIECLDFQTQIRTTQANQLQIKKASNSFVTSTFFRKEYEERRKTEEVENSPEKLKQVHFPKCIPWTFFIFMVKGTIARETIRLVLNGRCIGNRLPASHSVLPRPARGQNGQGSSWGPVEKLFWILNPHTYPCASDSEESTKSNPTPSSSSPPPFPLERLERQDAMPMPPGYFYWAGWLVNRKFVIP